MVVNFSSEVKDKCVEKFSSEVNDLKLLLLGACALLVFMRHHRVYSGERKF